MILPTHMLAGTSFGWLLAAAFVRALGTYANVRHLAIAFVLLAPLAARLVTGWVASAGIVGVGAAAVAALVLAAGMQGWSRPFTVVDNDRPARAGPGAALAVGAVAIGVVAVLAGTDPSRVLTTMLARPLGSIALDTIDVWRSAFLVTGLTLLLSGVFALVRRTKLELRVAAAVAGVALISLSASGAGTLLASTAPVGSIVPGGRGISVIGLASVMGTGAGIALAMATTRVTGRPSLIAALGATALACLTGAGAFGVLGDTPGLAPIVGFSAALGLAAGLGVAALWLTISNAPRASHGVAAAMGTAATTVGLVLGPTMARASGLSRSGVAEADMPIIAIAAMAALAAVGLHAFVSTSSRSVGGA